MTDSGSVQAALGAAAGALSARGRKFALVGGLAVSIRAEVRFTRDVDFAVAVSSDDDAERLVMGLRADGYQPLASVEHDTQERLATVRLQSPQGVKVDLLLASSGIEAEVIARARPTELDGLGAVAVARAEELLSLKVLSMTELRLQDRIDARQLVLCNPDLDLEQVRANLALITQRGFHRDQDLNAKLEALLADPAVRP